MKAIKIGVLILLSCCSLSTFASNQENWKNFSDTGAYGLVAVALITPKVKGDNEGFKQAAFSIIAASTIGLIGKTTIDEERPDKTSKDSFPSNHTANSFAAATTLYRRYGWQYGVPAYCVATLVGNGRVEARRHHWRDVIAGGILGSATAWYFTDAYENKGSQVSLSLGTGSGMIHYALLW